MRLETAERLKVLEEAYWGMPQNAEMGKRIAAKYKKDFGVKDQSDVESTPEKKKEKSARRGKKSRSRSAKRETKGILKNSANFGPDSLAKPKPSTTKESEPMFSYKNADKKRNKSKSKSRKRREESSPEEGPAYNDPR